MRFSEQQVNAIVRAVYGGVLTGAAAYVGVWQSTGDPHQALLPAIYMVIAYLAARGGVEGVVDTRRAARGHLIEGSALPKSAKGAS